MLVKPEILTLMKAKETKELRRNSFELDAPREKKGSFMRKNGEFERRKIRAEKLKEADKKEQSKDPEVITTTRVLEDRQKAVEETRQAVAKDIDTQKLAIQRRLAERRLRQKGGAAAATNRSSGSSGGMTAGQSKDKGNRSLLV